MDGSGTISRARGLLHRLERALAALDRCLAATHGTLVACAALVLAVLAITPNEWRHEGRPDSDALFYIAQKHQLEGASERDALDRVFSSKEARNTAAVEDEGVAPRVLDPAWQDYSKQFYERRWLVPALASGLDPLVGADLSFEVSSLIAYMLLGPLLFLLLRLRFPPGTCAAVALACLLLPPVRKWMVGVNVDAWGLVLLVAAVLSLMLVRERGLRWLAAWIPAMAALSLTRDATLVAACAALALLFFEWRRPGPRVRNAWLVASGAAAAAPALLLGGAPIRENIAYIIDGYRIPADDSWSYVASNYPGLIWDTVTANVEYGNQLGPAAPIAWAGLALCAAVVVHMLFARTDHDPYFIAARGLVAGGVAFLLIAANPQGWRLELVFVPALAVAIALALEGARASGRRTGEGLAEGRARPAASSG